MGTSSHPSPMTTEHPRRIRRQRTKGWRMPPNTVYVGRPTFWGNPWKAGRDGTAAECLDLYEQYFTVECGEKARRELRGKNLACWCPLDQPCHADVLLWIANEEKDHD